jgi:hypothetical protein
MSSFQTYIWLVFLNFLLAALTSAGSAALWLLSPNPTPWVIPSAVIVKYIIFDIYWLSSGLALDI